MTTTATWKRNAGALSALSLGLLLSACSDDPVANTTADAGHDSGTTGTDMGTVTDTGVQSLYDKYGGAPTVATVVDDAIAGLTADCEIAAHFAVVGQPGHDSLERLRGCLILQFTALLGGPATYPGPITTAAGTEMCEDMVTAHQGLGISNASFDRFAMDLVAVLQADGVSEDDIAMIAPTVLGLRNSIVDPAGVSVSTCADAGTSEVDAGAAP